MKISFSKYQGTGNDFIMIDTRTMSMLEEQSVIARLCHRKWGVGADGLIFIKRDAEIDFYMKYYNADGRESSMCGNGGRCAVAFSKRLGIISDKTCFRAMDGMHTALIKGDIISLQMRDVLVVEHHPTHVFLNTGSPHHVVFVPSVDDLDVFNKGRRIRHGAPYFEEGVNVNFVERVGGVLKIRTYERGVEDETLSCGTGTVAAAIAAYHTGKVTVDRINLNTSGGLLSVSFKEDSNIYKEIRLKGPAQWVFDGCIDI
ncbi:MAG: diaminopimelate epimerase [Flavobacteriales bacterium Tduv]